MKFTIALIALLCASTINATKVSNKFCPRLDDDFVFGFVQNIVRYIPNWRVDASFRDNLLTIADLIVDSGPHVYWDEKVDTKTNLVNLTEFLVEKNPFVDLDLQKTLDYNVDLFVEFVNNHWPIKFVEREVLNLIVRVASEYGFEGIDADKSLHDNIVNFVQSGLKYIKVVDIHSFKDWVDAVIAHETENFLGFGPNYTIQKIIVGFFDIMHIACISDY